MVRYLDVYKQKACVLGALARSEPKPDLDFCRRKTLWPPSLGIARRAIPRGFERYWRLMRLTA